MRHASLAGCSERPGCARTWLMAVVALTLLAAQSPPCGLRPPEPRLPPDRTLADQAGSPGPVVFRHATHVEFAGVRCVGCHPAPFSILGRHRAVTHDEMNAGRSCGICHNGSDATGVEDAGACTACHSEGGPR
jgi:c(7)-type cytochrome triheme protein